jgi:hypothetical protein
MVPGRNDEQGRWFNKPVEVKKARNLLGIPGGPAGEEISALFQKTSLIVCRPSTQPRHPMNPLRSIGLEKSPG